MLSHIDRCQLTNINQYSKAYLNKRISIFIKQISVFNKHISIFNKQMSIFNKHMPIFNKHIWIFNKHISIFNNHYLKDWVWCPCHALQRILQATGPLQNPRHVMLEERWISVRTNAKSAGLACGQTRRALD